MSSALNGAKVLDFTQHLNGPLLRLSDTPTVSRRAPPTLGEQTADVLAEFGVQAGTADGVIR